MSGWTRLLGTLGCMAVVLEGTWASIRMATERPGEAIAIQIGLCGAVVYIHRWWSRRASP